MRSRWMSWRKLQQGNDFAKEEVLKESIRFHLRLRHIVCGNKID